MEPRHRLVRSLATWFGCGYSPAAPGTVGTLGAVPLHWLLRRSHPLLYAGVVAAIIAVGIWCAHEVAEELGEEDPQIVVIDEVAGVLIALGLVRNGSIARQLAALVLFRVLDIAKPGPVARAEHAEPRGLGIMLDDLVAGLIAGIVTRSAR